MHIRIEDQHESRMERCRDCGVPRYGRCGRQSLFSRSSVDEALLESSTRTSMCPWKGRANYFTLNVNGERNVDAVWYYAEPKDAAAQIKGRVAFWKGVKVTP